MNLKLGTFNWRAIHLRCWTENSKCHKRL